MPHHSLKKSQNLRIKSQGRRRCMELTMYLTLPANISYKSLKTKNLPMQSSYCDHRNFVVWRSPKFTLVRMCWNLTLVTSILRPWWFIVVYTFIPNSPSTSTFLQCLHINSISRNHTNSFTWNFIQICSPSHYPNTANSIKVVSDNSQVYNISAKKIMGMPMF